MKKYFFILLAVTSLYQADYAQTSKQKTANIDKTKQEIKNNISNFKIIASIRNSAGYKYTYAKDKKVQLITLYDKEADTINKNVEWYFSNGHMIYAEQLWTNKRTKDTINHEEYYLFDSHVFAWVKSDNKMVDTSSDEFKNMANGMDAYAKKLEEENAARLK